MSDSDLTNVRDPKFDGYRSGSAFPSAEPLSAAVPEPASLIRLALAMSVSALAVHCSSDSTNQLPCHLSNANDAEYRSSGRKLIAILVILAYGICTISAVWPRRWLAPPAWLWRPELFVRHRSYRRSVGRLCIKQPSTLGDPITSKPTWWNTSRVFDHVGFFCPGSSQ